MDPLSLIYYMRKVLPKISIVERDFQNIVWSEDEQEAKVLRALSHYMHTSKIKNTHMGSSSILNNEAKYINKLFPSLKLKYIYEQLEMFKDMPDRTEIVLRIIVSSKNQPKPPEQPLGIKRLISTAQIMDNVNNNQPAIKVRKLADLTAISKLQENQSEIKPINFGIPCTITKQKLEVLKPLDGGMQLPLHNEVSVKVENGLKPLDEDMMLPLHNGVSVKSEGLKPLDGHMQLPLHNEVSVKLEKEFKPLAGHMQLPLHNEVSVKLEKGFKPLAGHMQLPLHNEVSVIQPPTNKQPNHRERNVVTSTITSNFQNEQKPNNNFLCDFTYMVDHFGENIPIPDIQLPIAHDCIITSGDNDTNVENVVGDFPMVEPPSPVAKDYATVLFQGSTDVKNFVEKLTPAEIHQPPLFKNAIILQDSTDLDNFEEKLELTQIQLPPVSKEHTISSTNSEILDDEPSPGNLIESIDEDRYPSPENPVSAFHPLANENRAPSKTRLRLKEELIVTAPNEPPLIWEPLDEDRSVGYQTPENPVLTNENHSPPKIRLRLHQKRIVTAPNKPALSWEIVNAPAEFKVNHSEQAEMKPMSAPLAMDNAEAIDLSLVHQGPVDDPVKINNLIEPLPSTSREKPATVMNPGRPEFNLIEYIRDITNVPRKVIRRYCRMFGVPTDKLPKSADVNMLVDRIFYDNANLENRVYYDAEEDLDSDGESDTEPVPVQIENGPSEDNGSYKSNNPRSDPVIIKEEPPERTQKEEENIPDVPAVNVDIRLVNSLCSMFPEACPNYIRRLCNDKAMSDAVLDDLITQILNQNNQYPKRQKPPPEPEVFPEDQLEILKEFLPDADPDYLRMMCDKAEGKPDMIKTFINEAMEKRNYPTMKDYQRRQQLSAQQRQYTTEFNIENFMKVIPDPAKFFSDPNRKLKHDISSAHYALIFLRNRFNRVPVRIIQATWTKHSGNLPHIMKYLNLAATQSNLTMKSVRKPTPMPNTIENIPLLQEIAYYTHETEISEYLKQKQEKEDAEREQAKNCGLLKTCSCCYDEEVLPKDIYFCENGCEFCKSCIVKSSEVGFGEGKLDFPCLMNCDSAFSLQTLQTVLCPKLFSKIAQKKALEEIKSAGIDELEMCPFCDFATIPADGYTIFTCMNPDCMKESCRMCKEPSHIPLRCEEIEKDEDVRARKFVEDKMTEALLRKCWKCGIKFFKDEGCNKMTCSCGAQMCYVCGKPVESYKHFNGNGGDRCPLYSDTNDLNKKNVLTAAEQAKNQLGNVNLKYDPSLDVDQYYKDRKKKFPHDHLLVGQGAAAQPNIDIIARAANMVVARAAPQPNYAAYRWPHH